MTSAMRRLFLITAALVPAIHADEPVTYNAHIRAIMSDKCIACHGPDGAKREQDLRLDTFEGATAPLKSNDKLFTIIPGDPANSQLFARIDSKDDNIVMPPPHYHKKVTKEERELLWKWIEQGAQYEAHWAYTPIAKTEPETEAKNPIDGFILDELAERGIEPSPRASHAELLRRLSLDLTGLPPTPAQVVAFEKAAEQDFHAAYKAEVERLLASPRYGERMSVPWLDIVRFADTVGYHGDQNQRIFPYRDYVIAAFNDNKPFSDFVIEQLAGDLLENPTPDQLVASGFNRLGMMSREGGIQPKEYLKKYAADRVRTVGQAFLGQTTGCAECHDHKFDPISARDFYSMAAFFDDMLEWGVYQNYHPLYEGMQRYNNTSPFPPEVVVKSDSTLAQLDLLEQRYLHGFTRMNVSNDALVSWQKTVLPAIAASNDGWSAIAPTAIHSAKGTPFLEAAGGVEFTGPPRKQDVISLTYALDKRPLGSIRMQVLPGSANGTVGRSAKGTFAIHGEGISYKERQKDRSLAAYRDGLTFSIKKASGEIKPLTFSWSQADLAGHDPREFSNGAPKTLRLGARWYGAPGLYEYPLTLNREPHTAVFQLPQAIVTEPGDQLVVTMQSEDIGRIQLSTTPFLDPIPGRSAAPASVLAGIKAGDEAALTTAYHLSQGSLETLASNQKSLRDRIRKLNAGWARSLVTAQRPLKDRKTVTRILNRGDWQDETGEPVEPAVFHFLPSESVPKDRRLNRLDLANWIVADENPLTARHFVNRTWKQFFGSGLSNVLADLGAQGEWPSHPKLLDWLAADFREQGWDVKNLVRTIVTSDAYMRKAAHREDLVDVDPGYRLIAQQAPRRLDAEFVRDNALAISGLLDTDITGGRSIFPYQPGGYYTAINFPTRGYPTTKTENQYRRGLYMHWQRTFMHPMLANFDAPTRTECSADRLQANSPQQALTLLNDPTFTEAARAFAAQLMSDASIETDEDFITAAYRKAIARAPLPDEMKTLKSFLATQRENIASGKDDVEKFLNIGLYHAPASLDRKELAAHTQLCRVVLNLHETITRY